jgi:hypothetical protein
MQPGFKLYDDNNLLDHSVGISIRSRRASLSHRYSTSFWGPASKTDKSISKRNEFPFVLARDIHNNYLIQAYIEYDSESTICGV